MSRAQTSQINGLATPHDAAGVPSEDFLARIPRDFAREHLIISNGMDEQGRERLRIADSTDSAAVFNTGVRLGRPVASELCDAELIARLIDEAYSRHRYQDQVQVHVPTDDLDELLVCAERDLLSTTGKGPVIRLVDALLFEALGRGASDVHVQPLEGRTLVRYRVDGVLHTARELPIKLTTAVVSRIKVMGRMDIAEKRLPQDGRATVTIGSGESARSIDLRISTLPTSHGERAVIRLLESARGEHLAGFESLGMPGHVREPFLAAAGRANGIVLVTGPTGSGKTTTLYTTLRWIATERAGDRGCDLNVMTIEDPIEYELSGSGIAISQAQVNDRKGVTFATGLRHILRQDPDVIMVGEIRDAATARIAIQASLTGHLVFSTLHTNDAAGAVTRLIDLGVEPYLVSASLSAVLAQRLVRRIHRACGGEGCEQCFDSGYAGRIGVFELLTVDDRVRESITQGGSPAEIRAGAIDAGMRRLSQEGARLVSEGLTGQLEVDRVVQATT
ncbi:MAG: type II/IV secretion system protein [Planctomycetes bacterium]|nr:type II/IV secretion system protein [Planctomycetota bacterium]